ncbi:hypothetical protein RFI_28103 [Reticulomyxa filosa]|uniref:RGS domain-containing protein n=1 Tax=Reticulomyxa filosa TaxID=46433 RepID=X6M5S9_RETFI|nr:hypothetical protein RFI_28103 [Reticulomyxa filosa]|eukprot:ETO09284.1 hypothetical protein RFI_28103 [Reticulomyxa filosa]
MYKREYVKKHWIKDFAASYSLFYVKYRDSLGNVRFTSIIFGGFTIVYIIMCWYGSHVFYAASRIHTYINICTYICTYTCAQFHHHKKKKKKVTLTLMNKMLIISQLLFLFYVVGSVVLIVVVSMKQSSVHDLIYIREEARLYMIWSAFGTVLFVVLTWVFRVEGSFAKSFVLSFSIGNPRRVLVMICLNLVFYLFFFTGATWVRKMQRANKDSTLISTNDMSDDNNNDHTIHPPSPENFWDQVTRPRIGTFSQDFQKSLMFSIFRVIQDKDGFEAFMDHCIKLKKKTKKTLWEGKINKYVYM